MLENPGSILTKEFLALYGFSSVIALRTGDSGSDSKALALGLGLGLALGIPLLLLIGFLLYRRRTGQVIHP